MLPRSLLLTMLAAGWTVRLVAGPAAQGDPAAVLERIGAYVEQYYSRAQSFVAIEHVVLHTLRSDLASDGFARRLSYELRVDWTPRIGGEPAKATMVRQLLTVNGRKPKPKDEPHCLDPSAEQDEPMSMLLPDLQSALRFTWAGMSKVDGRRVAMVDFRETTAPKATVDWKEDCMSVKVDGRSAGRVWADPESGEVLRIDVHLRGMVDFPVPRERQRDWGMLKTLDRSVVSVRYRPVTFHDPEEVILLPSTIESSWSWRGGPSSRYRSTQNFRNYKRFVAEGRLVESVEPLLEAADGPEVTVTR